MWKPTTRPGAAMPRRRTATARASRSASCRNSDKETLMYIKTTLAALAFATAGIAHATDVHVVSSGGFAQAYKDLSGPYERASGDKLVSEWGPSMGATKHAIPARLARGEHIDVVIMVGDALDKLMAEGKLEPGSKVILANSPI